MLYACKNHQENKECLIQTTNQNVGSRCDNRTMDYCNSLLINISKSKLYKLQKLQNAAAKLVVRCNRRTSMSEILHNPNCLRVESCIIYKIFLLVHKCVIGQCPENLKIRYKTYNCRPEEYLMLEVKHVKTNYGRRTFDSVSPRL